MAPFDTLPTRRGRPRKFTGPSRVVTFTLPDDVIAALLAIDRDLSRAVVRLAQPHLAEPPHAPAELSTFGDRAVIIVARNAQLGVRTGVELVPLSDGRALISFDEQLSIPQIELRIGDAVDDPALQPGDRVVFEALAEILRNARRSESIVLRQRSIIVLQRTGGRPPAAGRARRPKT